MHLVQRRQVQVRGRVRRRVNVVDNCDSESDLQASVACPVGARDIDLLQVLARVDDDLRSCGEAEVRNGAEDGNGHIIRVRYDLEGADSACAKRALAARPGTKPVSTAAGDTLTNRIVGASARASERPMVSSAALDAQ